MGAATILAFDKYLRGTLRPTTARRLSAYMSSRALATYTTYSFFKIYNDGYNFRSYWHFLMHVGLVGLRIGYRAVTL